MSDFSDWAGEFAVGLGIDGLPPAVVHEARRTLIDTIGVILAGLSDPVMRDLTARLTEPGAAVPVIGTTLRSDTIRAALIHGTAGVWHDFDAGNRFAGGHPAIHAIPAAISASAGRGVSGKRFIEAMLGGYEVGARIGRGATLREGFHPHGTWGAISSAVTATVLAGGDAAAVRSAMSMAAPLSIASSWKAAFEGATIRNVYPGAGAASGVLAAHLCAAGVTGESDGIRSVFGDLAGTAWNEATALEDAGTRWEIMSGYTKLLASARYIHPAIDAMLDAVADRDLDPDDIERIDVATFAFAATMTELDPSVPLAAKFSLPHALAAQIVLGDGGIDAFEPTALANPTIRALSRRVHVTEDPAMSARTPAERPASVAVTLRDGSMLRADRSLPHGDDVPVSDDAISAKFMQCSTRLLDEEASRTLLDGLWNILEVDDVDGLW